MNIPVVRGQNEVTRIVHEFDALVTAGATDAPEMPEWNHPNHYVGTWFVDSSHSENPEAPVLEQIRAIVEWGAKQDGKILVHCLAGMSRSTAIAWGIMIAKGVDAEEALQALFDAHPSDHGVPRAFDPNRLIVRYLGIIFDRDDLPSIRGRIVG